MVAAAREPESSGAGAFRSRHAPPVSATYRCALTQCRHRRRGHADRMKSFDPFTHTIWGAPTDEPFDATRVTPGHFDMEVLYQQIVWVDRAGTITRLCELDPRHASNIAAMLTQRAVRMHHLEAAYEALGLGMSAAQYLVLTDLWRAPDTMGHIAGCDPYLWLEATPLMRTLRAAHPHIADAATLQARAESDTAAGSKNRPCQPDPTPGT